ncbi:hypothetical protein [Xenorhabdus hominickii]|uniref:hypothetical protein n=1 Tax=Xenorhabdus hominickii TaxID=351679 RepID=UPI0012EEA1D1|nr:hypothetical protein [Xenorhabdus hominickii]
MIAMQAVFPAVTSLRLPTADVADNDRPTRWHGLFLILSVRSMQREQVSANTVRRR